LSTHILIQTSFILRLSELDEYERHFTVMNYESPERLLHMKCEQFVPEFEQQYEQLKWMDIEVKN
jgi:tubulin--tyrosine ligase-like protein 12